MAEDDTRGAGAHGSSRLNELRVLEADDLSPDHSAERQPGNQRDGDEQVDDVLSEQGHHDDDEKHIGKPIHDVDEAHDEVIQFATDIARNTAQRNAHDG